MPTKAPRPTESLIGRNRQATGLSFELYSSSSMRSRRLSRGHDGKAYSVVDMSINISVEVRRFLPWACLCQRKWMHFVRERRRFGQCLVKSSSKLLERQMVEL